MVIEILMSKEGCHFYLKYLSMFPEYLT